MRRGSRDGLEQELDNLDVTYGLRQRLSPSVQPMTPEKERMGRRVVIEHLSNLTGQPRHVLVVLDDWNPFSMLMGSYALETLQHFVSLDSEPSSRGMAVGEEGTPHRVRVEHGAGSTSTDDFHVDPRLRRGLAWSRSGCPAVVVDFEDLLRCQVSLVGSAARNRKAKGIATEHGAEIAARTEYPATSIEAPPDLNQPPRDVQELFGHCALMSAASAILVRCRADYRVRVRVVKE